MIIDFHCHLAPPGGPGAKALNDVDAFVERKARDGIDLAVVCQVIPQLPRVGNVLEHVKRVNEFVLGARAEHPDRIAVMAGVDPFGGEEMMEQGRRAVQAGSSGLTITASADGRRLDDPAAEDVWALAEELQVPILVHPPVGPIGTDDRRLAEFVTRAVEVALSLGAAILAGVLDRHPSLSLVAGAGGGGVAALAGRLDAGYRIGGRAGGLAGSPRPDAAGTSEPRGDAIPRAAPSTYLRRMYVDTLTFSASALGGALEVFGPDHVLFGTDWPPVEIPISVSLGVVRELSVTDDVRAGILGNNAAALLGLPASG